MSNSKKNILVTGGAGFIGSHLADRLIDEGHSVVILDNLSTGQKENVNPKAVFHQADICDRNKVAEIFAAESFDAVYHLAAQIDLRHSVDDPITDNAINVIGGLNILENSRANGVKKFVFVSSGGAVYGDTDNLPIPEQHDTHPTSPYAIHKLAFEKYLRMYSHIYDMDFTTLRFSNVYGPRQYNGGEAGVISIYIDGAVNGRDLIMNGDGHQTRDYIYVSDAVEALVLSLKADHRGEINVGCGKEIKLIDVVDALRSVMTEEIKVIQTPAKHGEVRRCALDNSRAKAVLGWEPKTSLVDGIHRTYRWSKLKKTRKEDTICDLAYIRPISSRFQRLASRFI